MRAVICILVLWFLFLGAGLAQVSSITINKQTFLNPTIESMGYLMENVDSVKWNEALLPMGIPSLPASMKVNALEYKKSVNGITQYIGFDDRYWVLTIIWKDESGKNILSSGLKKKLKGKNHTVPGTYKIQYKGMDLIISIETNKDKVVNEMITMEIERKY